MLEELELDKIKDEGARRAIVMLLNLIEELKQENRLLREENQRLRDENNRLKGEQGKPNIKPNKPAAKHSSEAERHKGKEWHKSSKKAQLKIYSGPGNLGTK